MSNKDDSFVRGYLPHRNPFLLVDKVLEIVPNESIVALKNVSSNEPFFIGHFPQRAIMPGVLMIEALAQASGILIYQSLNIKPNFDQELYYLAGVEKARFKHLVIPGDQLMLHVSIIRQRRDLWRFKGEALVGEKLACSAEFLNVRVEQEQ